MALKRRSRTIGYLKCSRSAFALALVLAALSALPAYLYLRQSPPSLQASFIGGLFGGGGSCPPAGAGNGCIFGPVASSMDCAAQGGLLFVSCSVGVKYCYKNAGAACPLPGMCGSTCNGSAGVCMGGVPCGGPPAGGGGVPGGGGGCPAGTPACPPACVAVNGTGCNQSVGCCMGGVLTPMPKPCCNPAANSCNLGTCQAGTCGNGSIEAGENCMTCPADVVCTGGNVCNVGSCIPFPPPFCTNDTVCLAPETCICADCGCPGGGLCIAGICTPPPLLCGNGICAGTENCSNCIDCACTVASQSCMSGVCDGFETNCWDGNGDDSEDNDTLADCADTLDCSGQSCALHGKVCNGGACVCLGAGSEVGLCNDSLDNDCDGTTDCMDSNCTGNPICPLGNEQTRCSDLVDNDSDGYADCLDVTDCADGTMCRRTSGVLGSCNATVCCAAYESALGVGPTSECGNGQDDDCDGAADCADSNCTGSASCCGNPGDSCMIPSYCCGGLNCTGPIGSRTCNAPPPSSLVPPIAPIAPVIPVLPTIPTAPVVPVPATSLAPTTSPASPSFVPPSGPTPVAPFVPAGPATSPVWPASPTPAAVFSFCSSPAGCHLGLSVGVCSYLPNSFTGQPSTCTTPGESASTSAALPGPAGLTGVPTAGLRRRDVTTSAPVPTICPYTTGCHTECILNRWRLRPETDGSAEDFSYVGTDCESPPDAERPSLFDRMVSGVRRLFYRPLETE